MAREKRSANEESPTFVWEGDDAAEQQSEPEPAKTRGPFIPGRALIAGTVVVVLAAGTLGVVDHAVRHSAAVATAGSLPTAPTTEESPASAFPMPSTSPTPSVTLAPTASASTAKPTATLAPEVVTVIKTVSAPTAAGPKPIGEWLLSGNALDSAGSHNGITSEISFSGGAAVFAGSKDSYVATSSTVLNTGAGASFTVSAWVKLTAKPTSASEASTAVSQNAGVNSAFYLQYFGAEANRWAFARMDTDTVLSKSGRAESTSVPSFNTWTHLVGVYEASNSALYLYVNGDLQGTATDTTPFASSGPLVIGHARYNSTSSDFFTGDIKDVKVFNQALSAAEVEALD